MNTLFPSHPKEDKMGRKQRLARQANERQQAVNKKKRKHRARLIERKWKQGGYTNIREVWADIRKLP